MSTKRLNNIKIINYDIDNPLPMGRYIFYLCIRCKTILKSIPEGSCYCKCHNIFIDIDAGRAGFKQQSDAIILSIE
jgi:hypothetical protein